MLDNNWNNWFHSRSLSSCALYPRQVNNKNRVWRITLQYCKKFHLSASMPRPHTSIFSYFYKMAWILANISFSKGRFQGCESFWSLQSLQVVLPGNNSCASRLHLQKMDKHDAKIQNFHIWTLDILKKNNDYFNGISYDIICIPPWTGWGKPRQAIQTSCSGLPTMFDPTLFWNS